MQPGAERVAHPERSALADEHLKRRLEGVLRLVLIPQDRPAGAKDHRPVPLDEGREGQL